MSESLDVSLLGNDLEDLIGNFNCYICMELLEDPRTCPHCSKLGCFKCLKEWFEMENTTCPHCRKEINIETLNKCRSVDDFLKQLEKIREEKNLSSEKLCLIHPHEKKTVLCLTCSITICKECALFNKEHSSHTFKNLGEVKKEIINRVNEKENDLEIIKKRMLIVLEQVSENESNLEENKKEIINNLDNIFKKTKEKLNEELENIKEKLCDKKNQIQDKLNELDTLNDNIHDLKNIKPINLITEKEKEMMNKMSSFHETTLPFKEDHKKITFDLTEIIPEKNLFYHTIEDFSNFHALNKEIGPVWHFDKTSWKLEIISDINNELTVFLWFIRGNPQFSLFEITIEIIHEVKNNLKFSSICKFIVNKREKIKKFCKISSLINQGFVFENKLKFMVGIKWPSYKQKADHFECEFNKLKKLSKYK